MKANIPKHIFVTGIDTNIGKTVASTILCEALQADYWKPVQSGSIEGTDSDFVKRFSSENIVIHPSAYSFKAPVSPHLAAEMEQSDIRINQIKIPHSANTLIIEGAGGIMVPLNGSRLILDLILQWKTPVVVVSKNYLGSINHTMLTCEILKLHGANIMGILFNGAPNISTESYILKYTQLKNLGRIEPTKKITRNFIIAQAAKLRARIEEEI